MRLDWTAAEPWLEQFAFFVDCNRIKAEDSKAFFLANCGTDAYSFVKAAILPTVACRLCRGLLGLCRPPLPAASAAASWACAAHLCMPPLPRPPGPVLPTIACRLCRGLLGLCCPPLPAASAAASWVCAAHRCLPPLPRPPGPVLRAYMGQGWGE